MKRFVLLVVSFLMATMLFAGPFGLEMGMTLDEIREKCGSSNVEGIQGGVMWYIKPPRPSNYFSSYEAWCDDSAGLHTVAANTFIMPYKQCILSLESVFSLLKSYYGEPQEVTQLKDGTHVYMTSESPDTIVQYGWRLPECKKLEKENVYRLHIWIGEMNQDQGIVRIMYFFDNYKKLMEAGKESPPF